MSRRPSSTTQVPVGAKLRLFGSAHTKVIPGQPEAEHEHLLATLPPAELLPAPPTTYRRWWNNSWHTVEEGGQRKAGDWTADDDRRLRALVDYAHKLGYWIRFYTLDGFTAAESKGWDQSYNFGSREAAAAALESRNRRRRQLDRVRPVRGLTHSHARNERTKIASGCASEALVSGQVVVSFLSRSVLLCPDCRPRPERQCHR